MEAMAKVSPCASGSVPTSVIVVTVPSGVMVVPVVAVGVWFTPATTAMQAENSEVLPAGSVAVAVMNSPSETPLRNLKKLHNLKPRRQLKMLHLQNNFL